MATTAWGAGNDTADRFELMEAHPRLVTNRHAPNTKRAGTRRIKPMSTPMTPRAQMLNMHIKRRLPLRSAGRASEMRPSAMETSALHVIEISRA